jgi:hypothetical protein
MKHSSFLNLNWQDLGKGLIMAVGGAVFAVIQTSISAGVFVLNWADIWHTALAAIVVYLGKNVFTPTPKVIQIDPSKTSVIDSDTKQPIISANQ